MIKAVIFDCFGVLVTENWLPFKRQYFSGNQALFEEATDLGKQLNSGLIDYQGFLKKVAEKAGISEARAFQEIDGNVANEELFDYIAQTLRPRLKIGMLSNVGNNWLSKMFTVEQLALFDEMALSYKTGLLKPESQAYHSAAAMLGVEPDECVFIDDQERHCTAAREAGMRTIVYKNFEQMRTELEKILAADTKG